MQPSEPQTHSSLNAPAAGAIGTFPWSRRRTVQGHKTCKERKNFLFIIKAAGYLFNLKTYRPKMICRIVGSPEVYWHTVLWAAVIGKKTSVTSQKTWGEFLTSAQPLVVVKLEPLVKCKMWSTGPGATVDPWKIDRNLFFITSYVEMWESGVILTVW